MKTNKYIKVIKTNKYKDINLYLRFTMEIKGDTLAQMCLLSKLIGDVSKKYPSKVQMAKAKDFLYGISCDCGYKANVNLATFSIRYAFINPKFVDVSIGEYNSFIKETLYNSIIDEDTLKEAKSTLKASLLRKNDKPANLASERFNEIISKDNKDFINYCYGDKFIKQLEKVKLNDLIETYRYIINKAQLNVYLCGDVSDDDINCLTIFRFDNRNVVQLGKRRIKYSPKKTIVETKDLSQSYLSVAYVTPYNKNHKEYFAWFMGNCLLGNGPTSLLFREVREKLSLCYAISSSLYKNEGIVRIATSIDGKNKDLVLEQINKQIERLINKDYELKQLEMTKAYISNILLGIYDDLDALIDYYFESSIAGFDYSIEEYCQNINKVTMTDIAKVYKKYKHYFNYVLLGSKHE